VRKFFQINQYIKSPEVRVIDNKGEMLGVLKTAEAVRKAAAEGVDLVLVAEKANPPVARMIEFSKFKYQQGKKERSGMGKSKSTNVKEVRFTPFMANNDFERRLDRAKEFLNDGYRVKLVVKIVGRQITRKEFGKELMAKAIEKLADLGRAEQEPKWQGKLYLVQIKPNKTKNK